MCSNVCFSSPLPSISLLPVNVFSTFASFPCNHTSIASFPSCLIQYLVRFSLVTYKVLPIVSWTIQYLGEITYTLDVFLLLFLFLHVKNCFTYIPLNKFEIIYTTHWKFLECKEVRWYESILYLLGR